MIERRTARARAAQDAADRRSRAHTLRMSEQEARAILAQAKLDVAALETLRGQVPDDMIEKGLEAVESRRLGASWVEDEEYMARRRRGLNR